MTTLNDALNTGYSHEERDSETYSFIGGGVQYENLLIPQPVAGIIPFLEQHNSPYLQGQTGEIDDLSIVCYYLINQEKAVISNPDIKNVVKNIKDTDKLNEIIIGMFSHAMSGFQLIPSNSPPSETGQRYFDAEWLSMIISSVCQITNRTDFDAMWRIPLSAAGFYVAQNAKNNGMDGVGRQRDFKAAMKFIKEKNKAENGT